MNLRTPGLLVSIFGCLLSSGMIASLTAGEPVLSRRESQVVRNLPDEPISLGSRRELFLDEELIERFLGKAELRLHEPVRREIAYRCDLPWEGGTSGYVTVFQDGPLYRMYMRGSEAELVNNRLSEKIHPHTIVYAESRDGIHWTKPDLGLFEFRGSKKNNIVWMGDGTHNFSPFLDTNPDCPPNQKYKAVGSNDEPYKLYGFVSPDGIHWQRVQQEPILKEGTFDSQNVVFWDPNLNQYAGFFRYFSGKDYSGYRLIGTATSRDFLNWSKRRALTFDVSNKVHLYTNQVLPYYRAPHIYVGFPTRYTERKTSPHGQSIPPADVRKKWASGLPRISSDLTDGLFMSSRDGVHFKRWEEAFLRPGPQEAAQWMYGDNYQNWGLVETKSDTPGAPPEISIYTDENAWRGSQRALRRQTLRLDGFVSLHAPYSKGEIVTRVFTFTGSKLTINYATSGAGSVQIELQDASRKPLAGFFMADCQELYGDTVAQVVSWKAGSDVRSLEGKPVRMRIALRDADVYSFKFEK